MWFLLLLEWLTSGEALELACWVVDVLDGLSHFTSRSSGDDAPVAFISRRPWWPKPSSAIRP